MEDGIRYANLNPPLLHFLTFLPNFVRLKHRSLGIATVVEDIGLCTPQMPVALNALVLTSMMASASLAKSLRSVVDDPARMRRASIGSWARKRARRRVLRSALRDSMWRRRLEGFVSPGGDRMIASTSPAVM